MYVENDLTLYTMNIFIYNMNMNHFLFRCLKDEFKFHSHILLSYIMKVKFNQSIMSSTDSVLINCHPTSKFFLTICHAMRPYNNLSPCCCPPPPQQYVLGSVLTFMHVLPNESPVCTFTLPYIRIIPYHNRVLRSFILTLTLKVCIRFARM